MSQPATMIAPHTFIKGELRLDGPAVIAGRVEGNIAAADTLEIASDGIIDGDIRGVVVVIQGTVKGNISAAQACRMGASARVAGDLCTANLAIAEGAQFIGNVCVGVAAPDLADSPGAADPGAARPAPEAAVVRTVEAAITRLEQAARMEEPPPPAIPTTMTIPLAPEMPLVQVLPQNIQAALHRAPRIIKAR